MSLKINDVHLAKYGYLIDKPQSERQKTLKKNLKIYGALPVINKLKLIKQVVPKINGENISSDIEYVKNIFLSERKQSRNKSKNKSRNKSKK